MQVDWWIILKLHMPISASMYILRSSWTLYSSCHKAGSSFSSDAMQMSPASWTFCCPSYVSCQGSVLARAAVQRNQKCRKVKIPWRKLLLMWKRCSHPSLALHKGWCWKEFYLHVRKFLGCVSLFQITFHFWSVGSNSNYSILRENFISASSVGKPG